jgi:hypothetical protein
MRHIRPIFMHQLQRLYIRFDIALTLSDDDLFTIAQSMPSIEELSLTPDPVFISSGCLPISTLKSLAYFAQFCPMLRLLALCLNASRVSNSNNPPTSHHCFTALQRLNFGFSPCPDPLFAAQRICSVVGDCGFEIVSESPPWKPLITQNAIIGKRQFATKRQWQQVSGYVSMGRPLYAKIVSLTSEVEALRYALNEGPSKEGGL